MVSLVAYYAMVVRVLFGYVESPRVVRAQFSLKRLKSQLSPDLSGDWLRSPLKHVGYSLLGQFSRKEHVGP